MEKTAKKSIYLLWKMTNFEPTSAIQPTQPNLLSKYPTQPIQYYNNEEDSKFKIQSNDFPQIDPVCCSEIQQFQLVRRNSKFLNPSCSCFHRRSEDSINDPYN